MKNANLTFPSNFYHILKQKSANMKAMDNEEEEMLIQSECLQHQIFIFSKQSPKQLFKMLLYTDQQSNSSNSTFPPVSTLSIYFR